VADLVIARRLQFALDFYAKLNHPGLASRLKPYILDGAPSDIVLTREIKAAEIVRIPLSPTIEADAAGLLRSGKADVFGADSGVGYPAAAALPGAKIVPGAFAMVRVAAALPKGRSAAAQAALAKVLDEAKQTGVVQKAIDAKGLKGVNVATK
jgi:polar amino acid transport system substrate-binding protein